MSYRSSSINNVFAVLETQTNPIKALQTAGIANRQRSLSPMSMTPTTSVSYSPPPNLRPDIKIHTVVHDPSLVETAKDAGANVVVPCFGCSGSAAGVSGDFIGVLFSGEIGPQILSSESTNLLH